MKKLQEEQKKDQQMPERKFEKKKLEILSSYTFLYSFDLAIFIVSKLNTIEKNYPLSNIPYPFLHPPQI